jgi:UDP-GlcNAc:undecaprenyl-phosphate/decaprenyl-phosphate GlcNAc-1-phosphate transferase
MNDYYLLIFYSITIALSFPLYFKLAEKYKIVDVPNDRSSHDYITIRGAGILLIISSIFFGIIYSDLLYLAIAVSTACVVGYIDDRFTLKASLRLTLYSVAVLIAFAQLSLFNDFEWYLILCFFIVAMGVVNAYNFMDGINGLTAIYSIVILLSGFLIDYYLFSLGWFTQLFPYIIIYLLIFGYYNFRSRAKTFLGDAGSISLGLIAVTLVIFLIKKTDDYGFIALLAVYGVDSVGTIILRILRKENIFAAHRSHLYQDMTNIAGHSHLRVAIAYGLVQLAINVIWIANFNYQFISSGILLIMIFIPAIWFYLWYKKKHHQLVLRVNEKI